MHLQGCTLTQTPNQDAPDNLSPPSRVLYVLQEIAQLSVCDHQMLGSILQMFLTL